MVIKEDLKTTELKVQIHCEGCKRKVKKVLQSINGVLETTIDSSLSKVTVVGYVDGETLVKKLAKTGKPAELWPDTELKKNVKKEKNKENGENKENNEKKEKKSGDAVGGSSAAGTTEKSSKSGESKADGGDKKAGKKPQKEKDKGGSSNSGDAGNTNSGKGSEIPAVGDVSEVKNDSNPEPGVIFTINPGIVHHGSSVTATQVPSYYYPPESYAQPYYVRDPHDSHLPEYYPPARPPVTGVSGFDSNYFSDEETGGCTII